MLPSIIIAASAGTVLYIWRDLKRGIMSNQQKLIDIATRLSGIQGHFTKGLNEVRGEIERLRAQNADLDFAPVDAALDRLATGVEALDEITPDEIAPEEPTPSEPVPSEPGTGEPVPAQPVDAEGETSTEVPIDTAEPADSENPAAER